MHFKSSETRNKPINALKVCGKVDYYKCSIFGVYLNLMSNRGKSAVLTCSFHYHSYGSFFLAQEDVGLSKTKTKDCNYHSLAKKMENVRNTNELNDELP